MGSSIKSTPSSNPVQRKHFSVERRPKLLKDFLIDDPNSCSSSGFKSFPRKPLIPVEIHSTNINNNIERNQLPRSRSKAASSTISAFQAMINAVRSIHFSAVKPPPSILPRSLSRKLSKTSLRSQRRRMRSNNENYKVKTTAFTVKHIMRWRSFQDRVEVKSAPLDCLTSSPHQCCTMTTTTTTTTTTSGSPSSITPRSSNVSSSSWCGSDFTSEYLPHWVDGNKAEDVGKKDLPFVGEENSEEESTTGARTSCYGAEGPTEEKEQLSPVCVIDFEFEEDEEGSSSSFDHSLASVERAQKKFMDKIRRFESLAKLDPINLEQELMSMDEHNLSSDEDYDSLEEELGTRISYEEGNGEIEDKAWQLLNDVKSGNTALWSCKHSEDHDQLLLLEFFQDELLTRERSKCRVSLEFELELVCRGKRWLNGEGGTWVGWEVEKNREAHFSEMGKTGDWSKFEEEKEEVGFVMVDLLFDELLLDLIMM